MQAAQGPPLSSPKQPQMGGRRRPAELPPELLRTRAHDGLLTGCTHAARARACMQGRRGGRQQARSTHARRQPNRAPRQSPVPPPPQGPPRQPNIWSQSVPRGPGCATSGWICPGGGGWKSSAQRCGGGAAAPGGRSAGPPTRGASVPPATSPCRRIRRLRRLRHTGCGNAATPCTAHPDGSQAGRAGRWGPSERRAAARAPGGRPRRRPCGPGQTWDPLAPPACRRRRAARPPSALRRQPPGSEGGGRRVRGPARLPPRDVRGTQQHTPSHSSARRTACLACLARRRTPAAAAPEAQRHPPPPSRREGGGSRGRRRLEA